LASDFAVEMQDVVKMFGDAVAVDHVSMAVRQKEFFAMLGPSGCGKTTSLRMIAGFERPTSGRVLINGRDVGDTPPFQRNVNTVFQSYALFPHMTVEQNVGFGLEMKGTPLQEIRRRVGEALELVRLPQLARRFPKQMSGGQQQRVALARAMVNRTRTYCCSTNLSRPWTPSCAPRCAPRSVNCSRTPASPRSSSRTTRRRRWRLRTALA